MRSVRIGAIAFACLLAVTVSAEQQMFEPPEHNGYRVDICRVWGNECGQAAADEFCRIKGFERADMFMVDEDIGAKTPTRTLVDGKVCDQSFCDGFGAVSCTRPGAAPLSSTSPGTPQRSTGRLKIPGMSGPGTPQSSIPDQPPAQPPVQPAPGDEPPNPPGVLPGAPSPTGPPWTPKDVKDSRIDVQGQYALFRLLKGGPVQRIEASSILSAIKADALKGIYQEDQQVPAMRATELGKWWGQILPKGVDGVCMTQPAGKPPIIAMRRGTPPDKAAYDATLIAAWQQCGIVPVWPVRTYDPSASAGDPPGMGGQYQCHGPDDETKLRAQCDYLHKYNMVACDIVAIRGSITFYGEELYSYEECEERVAESSISCLEAVSKMCGK